MVSRGAAHSTTLRIVAAWKASLGKTDGRSSHGFSPSSLYKPFQAV
jgi:hypothetical protein